jgi:hypothetical protein
MPSAATLKQVARLAAFNAAHRSPTAAETRLIAEAIDAGATVPGFKWREYFGGETRALPVQFEGCHLFCEDMGNPAVEEPVALARDARDHFLSRVKAGDLKALAEQIDAEAEARALVARFQLAEADVLRRVGRAA